MGPDTFIAAVVTAKNEKIIWIQLWNIWSINIFA